VAILRRLPARAIADARPELCAGRPAATVPGSRAQGAGGGGRRVCKSSTMATEAAGTAERFEVRRDVAADPGRVFALL
jgi:hypothetical protein